jgi:hypothetical protein
LYSIPGPAAHTNFGSDQTPCFAINELDINVIETPLPEEPEVPVEPEEPVEEIAEQEFDVITYCYTDITSDDGDFTTGIAPLIFPNGRQNDTDCGKIGLWAFTNMRVLDYVLTLENTDEKNVAILGHSRLGKTSLVTGMLDERFTHVFSNNAGCAGDAIARGGTGIQFDSDHSKAGCSIFLGLCGRNCRWICPVPATV